VFSVLLTGPPGAGKTVALTALGDALVADKVEHAPAHAQLDGVQLALDTEQLGPTEIAERVRAGRPDMLAASPR
jgi:dephospho-CoA kinase